MVNVFFSKRMTQRNQLEWRVIHFLYIVPFTKKATFSGFLIFSQVILHELFSLWIITVITNTNLAPYKACTFPYLNYQFIIQDKLRSSTTVVFCGLPGLLVLLSSPVRSFFLTMYQTVIWPHLMFLLSLWLLCAPWKWNNEGRNTHLAMDQLSGWLSNYFWSFKNGIRIRITFIA